MSQDTDFAHIIASAVHDMKNSLGMLLHTVEELREELSEDVRSGNSFNTLQYEAQRVHGDLVQLLGLYRLDQKHLSAQIDEHFLPDFLDEQIARHQPLMDGMHLKLTTEAEPVSAFFDANLISGVLTNVINNAVRYTRGRIHLVARADDQGGLLIRVEDDGSGFPAHMQTGDAPTTIDFRSGDTRLGLMFAEQIAQLHRNGDRQGSIRVHNEGELGGGVFELNLP